MKWISDSQLAGGTSAAFSTRVGINVLLNLFEPLGIYASHDRLYCYVHHRAVGGGAVPVLLSRTDHHRVTQAHREWCFALLLHPASSADDVEELSSGVGVPGGSRAGRKRYFHATHFHQATGYQRLNPNLSAKIIGVPFYGLLFCNAL